jgi:hypothetical protein
MLGFQVKNKAGYERNWSYPDIKIYLLRAWKFGIRKNEE